MQDKKNRDIVDSQGNVIKSIKDNKTKQFLKDNIWNILSTGLATTITLVEMINLVISKNFSVSCSNFYGIDGKYFDGPVPRQSSGKYSSILMRDLALILLSEPH